LGPGERDALWQLLEGPEKIEDWGDKKWRQRWIAVAATLLGAVFTIPVMAEIPSSSALTGKVTSQAEGSMEGVIIGARMAGSTITTWVVSNAQGQ
jgi:hypothetical protein